MPSAWLSSGREADWYVDLRRITLDADAAPLVGQVMLETTADLEFDAVGGLTLGAGLGYRSPVWVSALLVALAFAVAGLARPALANRLGR